MYCSNLFIILIKYLYYIDTLDFPQILITYNMADNCILLIGYVHHQCEMYCTYLLYFHNLYNFQYI